MRRNLSFLICASSGAIGVTLLAELPLLVRFSINDRLIGTLKTMSPRRGGHRETRETRRM
jgi:hypothetical protein